MIAEEQDQCVAVSIVIPCYHEAGAIASLAGQLSAVQQKFAGQFDLEFVLVDDGSRDDTFSEMTEHFGDKNNVTLIRHLQNRGVAAAILTGLNAARSEIVVSMDSDCTYDPLTIDELILALDAKTVMVTASPYHPLGRVVGVPRWRLLLSQRASRMYRRRLNINLYTYTSCFRAYRRSQFINMELSDGGFVGIAEMLWLAAKDGGRIVEIPAELKTRQIGYSKLKTVPVIRKHLALMRRIRRAGKTRTPRIAA